MARLWDSSRTMNGGYSLEALTSNKSLMKGFVHGEDGAKTSMKKLFEKPNIKADGTPGKVSGASLTLIRGAAIYTYEWELRGIQCALPNSSVGQREIADVSAYDQQPC